MCMCILLQVSKLIPLAGTLFLKNIHLVRKIFLMTIPLEGKVFLMSMGHEKHAYPYVN